MVRVTNYNGFNPEQQDKYVIDILKQLTPTEIISREFELIKDQTIDIDSIEEYQIPAHVPITALEEKLIDLINEDRKAIKHLNKEIQSIKER